MPKVPATLSNDNGPDNQPLAAGAAAGSASAGAAAGQAEQTAQYNEAGVKSAQASWLDGMHALLYGPENGYLKQAGAAALGGLGAAQDAAGKLYQQAADSLANDTQRSLFGKATAPIMNGFMAQIHQHAQAQGKVYDVNASRARGLAARDLGINAWNPAPGADNLSYRQCAAILHNELENQFQHAAGQLGEAAGEDMKTHFMQHGPNGDDGLASLPTGIVNRLLQSNQPYDARRYFHEVHHTLPGPTRDKLQQYIDSGVAQVEGNTAALQAQAHSSDSGEQQKKLDAQLHAGRLSESAHAIASQKVAADSAQLHARQQQNDTRILQQVWARKQANPHAALTDLSGADYAYLIGRKLGDAAQAILDSHPASGDPALFNNLSRLAQSDPVKFAQTNLLTESGRLAQAHFQYLNKLQQGIRKQDPQAIQAGRQVEEAVASMRTDAKAASSSVEDTQRDSQAEADLRDQISVAQQKSGGLLSPDQMQNLMASYQANKVLQGGTQQALGKSGQQQSQPAGGALVLQSNNIHAGANAVETTSSGSKISVTNTSPPDAGQQRASTQESHDSSPPQQADGKPAATTPEAQQGATSSNAENLLPKYEVGEHFRNGVIGQGSDADSRVYTVKAHGRGKTVSLDEISKETKCDYDQLMALNLSHLTKDKKGNVAVPFTVPNGTALKLPTSSGVALPANHKPVVDINKSTSVLDNNTHIYLEDDKKGDKIVHKKGDPKTDTTFTGWCAHYVYDAIEAGLPKGKHFDRKRYAKDSGPSLLKVGYTKVLTSSDQLGSYTPKKGDVVVLQSYPGEGYFAKNKDGSPRYVKKNGKVVMGKDGKPEKLWVSVPAGHIAMYDGTEWVSDAKQIGAHRIWAGPRFQKHKVGMVIYRP